MATDTHEHGVIWVSSYPKSGNTWMRFVLAHLLSGDVKSSVDVDMLIPEAIMGSRFKLPELQTVLLKTHWKMDLSLPMMSNTLGFIYLVRNPLDVMLSQFHFNMLRNYKLYREKSNSEIKALKNLYVKTFIQYQGNPLVGDGGGNSSWVENISSWTTQAKQYPHVFVRYEDMIADPVAEIKRVAQFLNKKVGHSEILNIANKTSFKSMKKMEDKEIRDQKQGFFFHQALNNAHNAGGRFMRQGKAGQGKLHLDAQLIEEFFDTFEETMMLMGYKVNRKTGVVRTVSHHFEKVSPLSYCPEIGRVIE